MSDRGLRSPLTSGLSGSQAAATARSPLLLLVCWFVNEGPGGGWGCERGLRTVDTKTSTSLTDVYVASFSCPSPCCTLQRLTFSRRRRRRPPPKYLLCSEVRTNVRARSQSVICDAPTRMQANKSHIDRVHDRAVTYLLHQLQITYFGARSPQLLHPRPRTRCSSHWHAAPRGPVPRGSPPSPSAVLQVLLSSSARHKNSENRVLPRFVIEFREVPTPDSR